MTLDHARIVSEVIGCPWCSTRVRYQLRCPGTNYRACRLCGRSFTIILSNKGTRLERWEPPGGHMPPAQRQDGMDMATTELAEAQVPTPDDLLADVGPLSQLWYLHEVADHVIKSWVGMQSDEHGKDLSDDSEPVRALAAMVTSMGALNEACVLVSILPPEATSGPS